MSLSHVGISPLKIVILSSVHDFRMLRRGSIQSLASAMRDNGHEVTFISVRFSLFSLLKRDPRSFLWRKANRPHRVDGVRCYLWFTMVHPFSVNNWFLETLIRPYYFVYKKIRNKFVDESFKSADYIIIESGQGLLFADRARQLNSRAKVIYRASDKLSTIGAGVVLQNELEKNAGNFDWYCLLSSEMAVDFAWAKDRCFIVPQGINLDDFKDTGPNPYISPVNAVSVGSMLFDPNFILAAAERFPEIQFHIIGCGMRFKAPVNVTFYDEMLFKSTLRYLEFASFGIAPYRETSGAEYLSTTSLKLKQYELFGIPSVCPFFAVGQSLNRFGYHPGDITSIEAAITAALTSKFVPVPASLNWRALAERLLAPQQYSDCRIDTQQLSPAGNIQQFIERDAKGVLVSLVMCTFGDRERQLVRFLSSLRTQVFDSFELIVVDQNPPGYIDSILRLNADSPHTLHIRSKIGLSVARNIGLAHARGAIVGFPDDDCWYLPDTLAKVARFFEANSGISVLLGRTVDSGGAPSLNPLRKESGNVDKRNVWISGNSNTLFVRRSAVTENVAFDERIGVGAPTRFQSGEETDFVLSLIAIGRRAIYLNDLEIGHEQVETSNVTKDRLRAWRYSQGFGFILHKHSYGPSYLLYRASRSFASAAYRIVTLKFDQALLRVVWGVGTLVGYVSAMRERKIILEENGSNASRDRAL